MRTVFHLIEGDVEDQKTVLSLAENLGDDETVEMDDIAVVAQGAGITPLTTGRAGDDRVRSLMEEGVSFKACGNTLESKGLDESDLVDGVEVVSSGVGELTRLQTDGYAYIRP